MKKKPLFSQHRYYLLESQTAACKEHAKALVMHCMDTGTDSVTKARAANIISLLHDVQSQLDEIAKEFKWEQM